MQYETVSAFSAKTHLSQLLTEVEQGKHFILTRHNKPIATLSPIESEDDSNSSISEAIQAMKAFGERYTLGPNLTLDDLKTEGRR